MQKRASKVAHNRPRPFYFTVQPRPQPTAQNWFSILRNFGTRHLFSYLWSACLSHFRRRNYYICFPSQFQERFFKNKKKNGEIWSELKEEVWRNKAKGERRKEIVIILWRDRALSVAKVESQNSIVAVRILQIRNVC